MLKDRVAIITGASQGLGREIARTFLKAGASVTIIARESEPLEQTAGELRACLATGQDLLPLVGDVSKPDDVTRIVAGTTSRWGRIDILVNNAGVYGPFGAVEAVVWQEWLQTIEINVLGSVLMCREVLPWLKKQGQGKIIQLSGGGATAPMPHVSAYAVSKAAIVRFVDTLAEEVRECRIDVNALAPGALNTRMLEQLLAAGPDLVGDACHNRCLRQKESGGDSLVTAAELALFLASSQSDGITGKLISAVWDNWQELPEHREELSRSDIYTLRRIIPEDRGKDWRGNL